MTNNTQEFAYVDNERVRDVLNHKVTSFTTVEYAYLATIRASMQDIVNQGIPDEVLEPRMYAAGQVELFHDIWLDGRCTTVEFIDKMRDYWSS